MAFTAGLLHDVGKLVLVSVEDVNYAELVRKVGDFGPALSAAEESAIGFTHAALGARLLARWGLPENVCLAVQFHHQFPAAATQYQRLQATVSFANSLAHEMIDGPASTPAATDASCVAMDSLKFTTTEITPVIQQIRQALERVQNLLQMPR